jgi:hypothetical protein
MDTEIAMAMTKQPGEKEEIIKQSPAVYRKETVSKRF